MPGSRGGLGAARGVITENPFSAEYRYA